MKRSVVLLVIIVIILAGIFGACTVADTLISNPTTITLEAISDSSVSSSNPDSNYGSQTSIKVEITSGTEKNYTYTYIMFDLSSIPSNTMINSANLSLYITNIAGYVPFTTGGRIYTHYSTDTSWSEAGITWNNKPSFDSEATSYRAFSWITYVEEYYDWNVTSDVSKALSTGKLTEMVCWDNYTSEELYGNATFQSKEAAHKPKLTVEYSSEIPSALRAYLVVRGSDDVVYVREYDSGADSWESWIALPGSTVDSPAAAVLSDELHVVVRGMDGASLWHGIYDLVSESFGGWMYLAGSSPSAPVLTSNGSMLCLVVHGMDDLIYYRCYSEGTWGDWQPLPSGSTIDSPAAALLGDELHLVVRGMDGYSMWHKVIVPEGWVGQEWTWIPGSSASPPVLTACQIRGELYMLVHGSDDGVYECVYDAGWGGWTSIEGLTIDSPAATVCGDELHVIVCGSDAVTLWHGVIDLESSFFGGWSWRSGSTPSAPTLTS